MENVVYDDDDRGGDISAGRWKSVTTGSSRRAETVKEREGETK